MTNRMKYSWLLLLPVALVAMFSYEASMGKKKEAEEQLRIARQKVEFEQRKVIETLIASAKNGYPEAQKDLGNAYYYGKGIDVNLQEAEHWWEKAANQGNVAAQFNLGVFYLADGGHQDLGKAINWLNMAVQSGDKEALEELRVAKQKQEAQVRLEAEKQVMAKNGELMEAITNDNLEEVKRLLDEGVEINAWNKDGDTALMYASEDGKIELVKLLLDKGADVNATGYDGCTALIRACENEKIEVIKRLLKNKADVNVRAKDGETALICACQKGNLEVAKVLIAKGADVNAKGEDSRTPLIMACIGSMDNQLEMIKLLLKNGSGVEIKDDYNETALMHAAASNNPKIVKLLIDKGADVSAATEGGYTLLMVAAQHDSPEVVRLLLDKGANVNAKSEDGTTALMFASLHGNLQIAKLLIDKGADANAKDIDGRTVIQCASIVGHPEMVNLLRSKSDITYVAGEGNRMCIVARNFDVMRYAALLDYQGDREAFLKALQQGLHSGEFVVLEKGTKCFVMQPIIDVSWCLIRPEGDPDVYYARRGDFSPRPGGQNKE